MLKLIRNIRYKISEPYRIRSGYGLSPLRTRKEYDALLAFCRNELADVEHMKLNPDRKRIYEATLALDSDTGGGQTIHVPGRDERIYYDVYELIEDFVGWYWS